MEVLIKNTRKQTKKYQVSVEYKNLFPIRINSLLYANDIVLMAKTVEIRQQLINICLKEIKKIKTWDKYKQNKVYGNKWKEGEQTYSSKDSINNKMKKSTNYGLNKTIFWRKEINRKTKFTVQNLKQVQ